MTAVPPAAAPVDVPARPTPPSFASGDVADSVARRIDEALPRATPPGAPAAAPPPEAPPGAPAEPTIDLFDEESLAGLDLSNLSYADGKKLEGEIKKARETYRPFRDAFGQLDDDQRQTLLESAGTLGPDLALLTSVASRLPTSDREWFQEAMHVMATDPAKGAEMLANGAAQVREALNLAPAQPAPAVPGQPQPDWAVPGQPLPLPDEQAPLTRADAERMFQEREAAREQTAAQERSRQAILDEARTLGYDPDATEQSNPDGYDAFNYLLTVAGRPSVGGDIKKAHEIVVARNQAVIDNFVQAKTADADRPALTPDGSSVPAQQRTLETLADAATSMDERLDAVLGPDLRSRR